MAHPTLCYPTLQLLYSSLVLVLSLVNSVYIIGNMGVLISNLDAAAVSFRKKRDAADTFVVKQNLPHGARAGVVTWGV